MERIWFVFDNAEVTGPFSTEEVKKFHQGARWTPKALIWWRGQKEWTGLSSWVAELPQILEARKHAGTKVQWFAHLRGQKRGPLSKSELIGWLRKSSAGDLTEIRVWTEGSRQWKTIFDFHELALEMGINARKTPRAGIFGFVTFSDSQLVYQLATIGAGGFGIEGGKDLVPGSVITITIKSPLLVSAIHAQAEVRYISPSGQAGLMFSQIGMESLSLIMDYVRQYRDTSQHIADSLEAEELGQPAKLWYLARNGKQEGPYSQSDLIQMLQWIEDRTDVSLWTEGMQHWASLFEFTDILEQTGLSRRAGPRAPLEGQILVQSPLPGGSFAASSISITGMGFQCDKALKSGEEVQGDLVSESLGAPIHFCARVKYVDASGYTGVEFTNLTGEIRKRIADYVQKFHPTVFSDEITQTTAA